MINDKLDRMNGKHFKLRAMCDDEVVWNLSQHRCTGQSRLAWRSPLFRRYFGFQFAPVKCTDRQAVARPAHFYSSEGQMKRKAWYEPIKRQPENANSSRERGRAPPRTSPPETLAVTKPNRLKVPDEVNGPQTGGKQGKARGTQGLSESEEVSSSSSSEERDEHKKNGKGKFL